MTETERKSDSAGPGSVVATFDLRAFIADFRRFTALFIVVFVAAFGLLLAPVFFQAKTYTATAQVMIDPRKLNTTPDKDVLSDLPVDTTTIDTEVEVLKSNALAERVQNALRLDEDPEFVGDAAKPLSALTPAAARARHSGVKAVLLSGLSVRRQGTTRVISISYTADTPSKAARIANEWSRMYLMQQLERKFAATKDANQWLNSRLAEMKTQVEEAETAVQKYKNDHGLLSSINDNTLGQQQIANRDQKLIDAEAMETETNARANDARRRFNSSSMGSDIPEVVNSQVIKDLRSQRTTITTELADLQGRYGAMHPSIVKARNQLSDIDSQIQTESSRIVASLESQAGIQHQRAAAIRADMGRTVRQQADNNTATVGLNELQRELDAASTQYQAYMDRFRQTSAQLGVDKADASIVSVASPPGSPSGPKIPLAVMIALIGGFGIAAAVVMIRRAFEHGLTTGEQVESLLNEPYLGSLPVLTSTLDRASKFQPTRFIVEKPFSAYAEAFRNLRAALLYSRYGEAVKVIAVTSALPGEGKTTASVCLAQIMALSGETVVVVDCDLRRRSINAVIGAESQSGLLDVVSGKARLDAALTKDAASGVTFLPIGGSAHSARDIFGSDAMDRLLTELRAQFDVIILDTAPILPVADTRILIRKADIVAMLVNWRKTPVKATQIALDIMADSGARLGGVALNQVNIKQQAKYGYGDSGHYYHQYKKYYAQ